MGGSGNILGILGLFFPKNPILFASTSDVRIRQVPCYVGSVRLENTDWKYQVFFEDYLERKEKLIIKINKFKVVGGNPIIIMFLMFVLLEYISIY